LYEARMIPLVSARQATVHRCGGSGRETSIETSAATGQPGCRRICNATMVPTMTAASPLPTAECILKVNGQQGTCHTAREHDGLAQETMCRSRPRRRPDTRTTTTFKIDSCARVGSGCFSHDTSWRLKERHELPSTSMIYVPLHRKWMLVQLRSQQLVGAWMLVVAECTKLDKG
jgi:hypothetical protein